MGIFNCASTLPAAIHCILQQTYQNWELILCDDGSSDDTFSVAEQFCRAYPDKICLLRNDKNIGLNATLNRCLAEARGDYIARMDGDDTCSPNRFEEEVAALINHPEYAIVSTDMTFFDEQGTWGRTHAQERPSKNSIVKDTPFCHAACMVRREAYEAVGGYSVDKKLLRVEDYHLWVKMYEKGFRGMNLSKPLYQMRDDRDAQNRKRFRYRINEAYVKALAIQKLNLSPINYIYCLRPILVGLLPSGLFRYLHKMKRKQS